MGGMRGARRHLMALYGLFAQVFTRDEAYRARYLAVGVAPDRIEVVGEMKYDQWIDPAQPVDLRLRMELGICKDICMPATLTLQASLSGAGQDNRLIADALANGPLSGAQAGLKAIDCDIQPIDDGLHIAARISLPQQGDPETVVFETADKTVWVDQATSQRDGAVLVAATDLVATQGEPFVLDRSGVTVTVIGQGRSVEIKGCPAP